MRMWDLKRMSLGTGVASVGGQLALRQVEYCSPSASLLQCSIITTGELPTLKNAETKTSSINWA